MATIDVVVALFSSQFDMHGGLMVLNLEDRIKNAHLTKIERQIADFFLDNRGSLYFMTAKDIAMALHVSDTSVIRLCRTLGYSGFKELQQILQKDLSETLDSDKYVLPYQQIADKPSASGSFQFLEAIQQNLINTSSRNLPKSIEHAAELLRSSEHIFVAGFRGSAPAACYLGVLLSQYIAHVEYVTKADSSCIESFLGYGEGDCAVLIGTERYSKMACILADMARSAGCHLIAIVDKLTSPLAYHADEVLVADVSSPTAFNSYIGIFFLLEELSNELSRYADAATEERLQHLNNYLTKLELY